MANVGIGTILSYNGIELNFGRITKFTQEAIYSEDHIDHIYNKITIGFEGVLSDCITTGGIPSWSPQAQIPIIREQILEPRKKLFLKMEGVTVVAINTLVDDKKGPFPKAFNVLKVSPHTLIVYFEIECYMPCPNISTVNGTVLSNRWSQEESVDDKFYTTRTITGQLIVSGAFNDLSNPDKFREQCIIPTCPVGYKRTAIDLTIQSDGLRMNFRISDKQLYLSYPAGAVDITASYTQQYEMDQLIAKCDCNVVVTGKPNIPKWRLLKIAMDIIFSRLHIITDSQKGLEILTGCTFREELFENKIECQVSTMRHPGKTVASAGSGNSLPLTLNIGADIECGPGAGNYAGDQEGSYLYEGDPKANITVPKNSRPGNLGLLFSCAFSERCVYKGTQYTNYNTNVGKTKTDYPPTNTSYKEQEKLPEYPSSYSKEQTTNPYTDYQLRATYDNREHCFQLPVADSGTEESTFVKVANKASKKTVAWTAMRHNDKPQIPKPDTSDTNLVLLDWNVTASQAEKSPNSESMHYTISGVYIYGMKKPLDITKSISLPVTPVFTLGYGDSKAVIDASQWSTGIANQY